MPKMVAIDKIATQKFGWEALPLMSQQWGLRKSLFWGCNRFFPIATQWCFVATPWSVARHSISNHCGCCNTNYCNTLIIARDTYCHILKGWQQVHQQRQWLLQQNLLPRINSIAIDGSSIATLSLWLQHMATLLPH